MCVNVQMKKWGFKEQKDFVGLMPKVMEMLGDDAVIGMSEEVVSVYDPTANGADSLKVVSAQKIANKK